MLIHQHQICLNGINSCITSAVLHHTPQQGMESQSRASVLTALVAFAALIQSAFLSKSPTSDETSKWKLCPACVHKGLTTASHWEGGMCGMSWLSFGLRCEQKRESTPAAWDTAWAVSCANARHLEFLRGAKRAVKQLLVIIWTLVSHHSLPVRLITDNTERSLVYCSKHG